MTEVHAAPDAEATSEQPAEGPKSIGPIGWLRWGWRQLTSMRTALVLLFLLALGSMPGSIIPQRGNDPSKVTTFYDDHPALAPWLDRFSLFDVFSAPWFVAIYLLLFISLTGCVVPRMWRQLRALRSRPPSAPRNLARLPQSASYETDTDPDRVVATARDLLRKRRFRTDTAGGSVAAEKGYLGELGNLLFHLALLMLLVAVAVGTGYSYKGNVLVTEGGGFSNALTSYDEFEPGSRFSSGMLAPFTVWVDSFHAGYVVQGKNRGQPLDFSVKVHYQDGLGGPVEPYDIRVNHPLNVGGTRVYLLNHGYAPEFTVRDGNGRIAYKGAVPFLPADQKTYTSEGVVKVPDAKPDQLGFMGLFWPTAMPNEQGKVVSSFPAPNNPMVALFAFKGDLGLGSGKPQSVYKLDTTELSRMKVKAEPMSVGQTMKLPDGEGSITFTGYKQWVALQVNHNPGRLPALAAAILAIIGIVSSFLIRRRRMWVRARSAEDGRTVVEVGGLTLGIAGSEFDDIVARLRADTEDAEREPASDTKPATDTASVSETESVPDSGPVRDDEPAPNTENETRSDGDG